MSASYTDTSDDGEDYFAGHKLSKLISLYLEPIDASPALGKTIRLSHLLLLSNQVTHAVTLMDAVYQYGFQINAQKKHKSLPYFLQVPSTPFHHLWLTHPEIKSPAEVKISSKSAEQIANGTWGWDKYRECTRTGWMLEHCSLPEPADPHIWRSTSQPTVLAMCARLLAKEKEWGRYPPKEQLKEALEAGLKLYSQPQVCISNWKYEKGKLRHSYLLYRRLMVEVAIRSGQLETAADILSMALRLDGFNTTNGGSLEEFLALPGIWDVLPLLAEKGKERNPFFIDESTAQILVKEIIQTLELRAEKGRQWSLAPELVGWEELLNRFAQGAWKVNRKEYKRESITGPEKILLPPATEEQIVTAEKQFGELPADFKDMLRVADGFIGGWHFASGGISSLESMQLDDDQGQASLEFLYSGSEYGEGSFDPENNIIALLPGASECDGFIHFIVLPRAWKDNEDKGAKDKKYLYFNEAPWRCGSEIYDSVRDWVAELVEKVEEMVERGKKVPHTGDGSTSESDHESDNNNEEGGTVSTAVRDDGADETQMSKEKIEGSESDWEKV